MDSKYITVGPRVELFAGQTVLPYPASKTDATAGTALNLVPGQAQTSPMNVALYLESDIDITIVGVSVHVFEKVEPTATGQWATLAVPGPGVLLFETLELRAGFPVKTLLTAIGQIDRFLVTVANLNGAELTGHLQRVEAS